VCVFVCVCVLPFWYRLTRVVPEKGPLNGCACVCLCQVIGGLVDLEQMQDDYERLVTNLLEWIHTKIGELNDRNFSNSLDGIKRDMASFTNYRLQEKPPKYVTCDTHCIPVL